MNGLRTPPSSSLFSALRNLPATLAAWRKEQGICGRCNGMRGIYVPSNGGRTFVNCPECKGTGRQTVSDHEYARRIHRG